METIYIYLHCVAMSFAVAVIGENIRRRIRSKPLGCILFVLLVLALKRHIAAFSKASVTLSGGRTLPIGRQYAAEVSSRLLS